MWENEALDRARQAFADQFETVDAAVVYRRRCEGEPVALTGWERDALIYDFNRRVAWLYAALIVLIVVVMLGVWAGAALLQVRPNVIGIAAMLGPMALAYVLLERWIWNAPQRLIARRGGENGLVLRQAQDEAEL